MRTSLRLALSAVAVASVASVATGCSRSACDMAFADSAGPRDQNAAEPSPVGSGNAPPSSAEASRAVSEADVVQLDHEQNRLYAMSRTGTLAFVDASQPGRLTLLGKTSLSGEPFEMYRRGDVLLTMSNHGVTLDGNVVAPLGDDANTPSSAPDPNASALVSAIDITNPANARSIANLKVAGEIADSRVVGNVLYLATYENGTCWGCNGTARTIVTTFDIADATAPKQVDQLTFTSPAGSGGLNLAWSTPWKRSIVATNERLYVGGLASNADTTADEGVIEVLDITDPTGHLVRGATITTAGPVMSRWQMDEHEGVLRVVSQRGAGRTANGEKFPDIDTFRIESTSSFLRLGHTTMSLPRQEGLKTVRFDGARAYAITFNQTDPLFTLDLSDAAHPVQKGELHIPGWVYHLEPRGDRLIGLGLDRTDHTGNLNVSLFDVSDMTTPRMLQRVAFGPSDMYEDYMITNGVLAEDQDRIQKAFRVFDDGLIAIPFSGAASGYGGGNACTGGGVQLVDWTATSLTKRALLPVSGHARRAIRRDSAEMKELIAVSDSNVSSFQIDQRDQPKQTADVVIGTCGTRPAATGGGGMGGGGMGGGGHGGGYDIAYESPSWRGETCE